MSSPKKFHGLNVSKIGRKYYLFFKDLSENEDSKNCQVLVAESNDGVNFRPSEEKLTFRKFFMFKGDFDVSENFQIVKLEGKFFLFQKKEVAKNRSALAIGVSPDGFDWKKFGSLDLVRDHARVAKVKKSIGPYLMFFGDKNIKIAVSEDLQNWEIERRIFLKPSDDGFDNSKVSVANVFMSKEGLVLLYVARNKKKEWGLGVVLLDRNDIKKVLWRSEETLWRQPEKWKNEKVSFVGSAERRGEIFVYWEYKNELLVSVVPNAWKQFDQQAHQEKPFQQRSVLEKYIGNPIIEPVEGNSWESQMTFNPTAVCVDGKVHLIYRAVGEGGMSMFGYASSKDGVTVDQRNNQPIYIPKEPFEFNGRGALGYSYPYMSGGGWGGCEDPRLTLLEDRLYLTYTAFNGHQPPGVAMSSIKIDDFLRGKWKWRKAQLLSKSGEIQKNWLVFPEKVNGKYAILHGINPTINIDYFDSLEEAAGIESRYCTKGDDLCWDNVVRGAAAAPLKTKYGWLLFYHAMDKRDPKHSLGGYWNKVGAMLLDYKDPTKVLHRSPCPLLEADRHYEKGGAVPGAVYVCGSVIKDDYLFVYYGGADTVGCVAKASLNKFLSFLTNTKNTLAFERLRVS